jgi:CheY-like chemotaxis protein
MVGMTGADGVQRLADVLDELRAQQFSDGQGGWFTVSFSAGVAQYPDDGRDLRALYRVADSAVHRAKEVGGDRVVPVGWSTGADSTTDVVLVEDDDALAGVLLHGLSTRAYRTRRFDDGQDAASALEGPSPKVSARVVLLDWGMPSLDGLRVLRRLADTGVLNHTRVIMLTARDSESEVLMALDLGAFDHVAKPFSVPVLMKRVHRAMQW